MSEKPAVITNHDLSPEWWMRNYTENELNEKARKYCVPVGSNIEETAKNLQSGNTGKGIMTIAMAYPDHKSADTVSVCP